MGTGSARGTVPGSAQGLAASRSAAAQLAQGPAGGGAPAEPQAPPGSSGGVPLPGSRSPSAPGVGEEIKRKKKGKINAPGAAPAAPSFFGEGVL